MPNAISALEDASKKLKNVNWALRKGRLNKALKNPALGRAESGAKAAEEYLAKYGAGTATKETAKALGKGISLKGAAGGLLKGSAYISAMLEAAKYASEHTPLRGAPTFLPPSGMQIPPRVVLPSGTPSFTEEPSRSIKTGEVAKATRAITPYIGPGVEGDRPTPTAPTAPVKETPKATVGTSTSAPSPTSVQAPQVAPTPAPQATPSVQATPETPTNTKPMTEGIDWNTMSFYLGKAANAVMGQYKDSWQAQLGGVMSDFAQSKAYNEAVNALATGATPPESAMKILTPEQTQSLMTIQNMQKQTGLEQGKLELAKETTPTRPEIIQAQRERNVTDIASTMVASSSQLKGHQIDAASAREVVQLQLDKLEKSSPAEAKLFNIAMEGISKMRDANQQLTPEAVEMLKTLLKSMGLGNLVPTAPAGEVSVSGEASTLGELTKGMPK